MNTESSEPRSNFQRFKNHHGWNNCGSRSLLGAELGYRLWKPSRPDGRSPWACLRAPGDTANLCSCSYVHTAGALTAPSGKNLNSHQVDDSAIGYSQAEPTEPGERRSYLTPRMTSRQMLNNISHEQKSDAIYKQLKSSHPRRANSQGKGHLVGFWSDSRAVFVSCIRLTRLGPVCDNPVSGSLLGIFSCSHLCRSIQSLKSMV